MSGGNGFTNKEILLRLEAKVDAALRDLEPRVSSLERFRSYCKGAAGLTAVVAPLALALLK